MIKHFCVHERMEDLLRTRVQRDTRTRTVGAPEQLMDNVAYTPEGKAIAFARDNLFSSAFSFP